MLKHKDCRVRKISREDEALILSWRNSERVRQAMFKTAIISAAEHHQWFAKALTDSASSYLVFLVSETPVGLVYFPHIDALERSCHWGFYVGAANAPHHSGSALGFLGLDYAFGPLKLQRIIGQTRPENKRGQRLHERLGFRKTANADASFVEYALEQTAWVAARNALSAQIFNESEVSPR